MDSIPGRCQLRWDLVRGWPFLLRKDATASAVRTISILTSMSRSQPASSGTSGAGHWCPIFSNHPNLAHPTTTASDQGVGEVSTTELPPTSILGAGLGVDVFPHDPTENGDPLLGFSGLARIRKSDCFARSGRDGAGPWVGGSGGSTIGPPEVMRGQLVKTNQSSRE